ncbi:hypothetical protein JYB64_08470 [Algoriphagus aestuarii]|nr:hypothetical protein [Algoriphagus aestuarii]
MIIDLIKTNFINGINLKYLLILFLLILSFTGFTSAQSLPTNFPLLEEVVRRNQLDTLGFNSSFLLRPNLPFDSIYKSADPYGWFENTPKQIKIGLLPLVNTTRILTGRPYGWAGYGMIPNPGIQTYLSGGIQANYKFINFTFRPEFVLAQNSGFQTGLYEMTDSQKRDKFFLWNWGDFPERFGNGWMVNPWWGQSKLTFQYGAFELGGSTENIWWGPGQWNSLTFSNNAQGFPHLTFNTTKPAKTFLGNFEGQLIMGRLENSGFSPSQNQELNSLFFTPFTGDWRYLNAISISYNPKWLSGLYVGFARTFQQYNASRGSEFLDWFPIFEGFQKKNVFENGHSVEYDGNGRDQTITIFGRYLIPKAKTEIYFEYGRRDHAYTWREFTLNPEHARAYILGFNKLVEISNSKKVLQIRGEITHQQESINRTIRHGIKGGLSWHTHNPARGFVNYGQPLGVGIGVGSNVQTLELALVDGMDKLGLQIERLANNQDFYYKAQLQDTERKPWVDLSLGFLYDKKFNNLLLCSKLQVIYARNYQWQLDPSSTPDFPKGKNLTSVLAQTSLIYFWNK